MDNKYAKAYTEVLEIISHLTEEEYQRIPKSKINFLKEHCDKNYDFRIDPSKPLVEQNISEEANAVFITIFRDFFATPKEIIVLNDILEQNSKKSNLNGGKIMNKEVSELYDSILKMFKVFEKLGREVIIEGPMTEIELKAHELELGFTLPEDYKDWLRLTKHISVRFVDLCIWEGSFHGSGLDTIYTMLKDNSGDYKIGRLDLHNREIWYKKEYNKWTIEDWHWGGCEECETFTDVLRSFYSTLISDANTFFPNVWKDVFNEMFN